MFQRLKERKAHKREQAQATLIKELAKGDAHTLHDLIDLDQVGMLDEKNIEALATEALKMHRSLSEQERAVYLPAFKSEVSRLDLEYSSLL